MQGVPAYGDPAVPCATDPSCKIVVDASTLGYVIGHGAQINVTDDNNPTNPKLIVTNVGGTGSSVMFTREINLGYDPVLGNFYVGSAGFPNHLMFTSSGSSNTSDPPNLSSSVVTGSAIKIDYYDDQTLPTPTLTTTIPLVAADTGGTLSMSTSNQPIKNVVIQCPNRAGTSGDFICDSWKTSSGLDIPYVDSASHQIDYTWPCTDDATGAHGGPFDPNPLMRVDFPCPKTTQKDVYVEVDWMQNHAPSIKALKDVVKAYAAVTPPIFLHIQLSDEIPHRTNISGPNNGNDLTDFTKLKSWNFGTAAERSPTPATCKNTGAACVTDLLTAKREIFHYVLFGHSQTVTNQYSSGISESASVSPYGATNDGLISLGKFSYAVGSIDQQEGTLMHELGHQLGLNHGGAYKIAAADIPVNCKPNYLSVMSYTRQFSDLFINPGGRSLNYSGESDSSAPSPSTFMIGENKPFVETPITNTNQWTVFGIQSGGSWMPSLPTPGNNPDWDNDVVYPLTETSQDSNEPLTMPLLNQMSWTVNAAGIGTVGITCPTSASQDLHTYNDWSNLMFDITTTSSYSDGAGTAP